MLKMMLSLFGLLFMTVFANDGGEGDGEGEGGGGEGGEGNSSGDGGGQPSQLEQDAQAAIQQLKDAGAEIPQALEKAVKELSDARKEAASYRTGRNELRTEFDALKTGLAKALGLNGDEPPDPERLQTTLAERDADLRTKTVELAAHRAAGRHDADADALLDSRSFLDEAAKLDPTADDFSSQLDAAILASLEANPKLKATPGGGRGPGQGPRNTGPQKPDMDALLRAAAGR